MNKSLVVLIVIALLPTLTYQNNVGTFVARLGNTVKSMIDENFDELNDKPTPEKMVDTAKDIVAHLKE